MDKKIAGMLGAVAGLAAMGAQADAHTLPVPGAALQPASYADLLAPIPNAVELLNVDDAVRMQIDGAAANEENGALKVAYDHHHHHHHRYHRRRFRHHHHHHHHHHHNNAYIAVPGVGVVIGR